jgi:hypothetical protein
MGSSTFIEPPSELQLIFRPEPGGPAISSADLRDDLLVFAQDVSTHGIERSNRARAYDSAGGGVGGTSEIFFVITAATTGIGALTAALVQARKLIEAILKLRQGTQMEIRAGRHRIKGSTKDIEKYLPPEVFAKLIEENAGKPSTIRKITNG